MVTLCPCFSMESFSRDAILPELILHVFPFSFHSLNTQYSFMQRGHQTNEDAHLIPLNTCSLNYNPKAEWKYMHYCYLDCTCWQSGLRFNDKRN